MGLEISGGMGMMIKALGINPDELRSKAIEFEKLAKELGYKVATAVETIDKRLAFIEETLLVRLSHLEETLFAFQTQHALQLSNLPAKLRSPIEPAGECTDNLYAHDSEFDQVVS